MIAKFLQSPKIERSDIMSSDQFEMLVQVFVLILRVITAGQFE